MKLLMHTCCAPCSVYCIESLKNEGIIPTLYWYNPNIHPYQEYKARRDCLKQYAEDIGIHAIFQEEYGLDEFCKNVINNLQNRCVNYCYKVRLEQTAKYAKENELDVKLEELRVYVQEQQKRRQEKYSFILSFKQNKPLKEFLDDYKKSKSTKKSFKLFRKN